MMGKPGAFEDLMRLYLVIHRCDFFLVVPTFASFIGI
jgi:hypothetical protein